MLYNFNVLISKMKKILIFLMYFQAKNTFKKYFHYKTKLALKLRLFYEKWFPENHFPNFHVFIYHEKSWSTKNTFMPKKNLS